MMKKLLFLSSAKLTAMCFGLLLAVFCTIGMSFTPATEDNVADPNDPTSQVRKPRRGPGWCGHDTDYFQGIAISKKQGGTGKVYVQRDEVGDVATITGWQDEYTTDVLNCAVDEDNNNDYLNFYAKVESGYFWGWYADENCTEVDDSPEEHTTHMQIPLTQYSTDETQPEIITRYAKFSNEPYPYHWYYSQLRAISNDIAIGGVQANLSQGEDGYGNWYISYLSNESTSDVLRQKTTEPSSTGRIYATALPMHGYKFTGWTLGSGVSMADGFTADNWQGVFDIPTTSENADSPTTAEVTAHFATATPTSITLLKDANRGSVAVSHYYYLYDENSSVHETSIDVAAFPLEDATYTYTHDEEIYLYPGDRLNLTATPAEGYTFYGWYHEVGDRYEFLGAESSIKVTVDEYPNYYAYFDVVGADNAFMVGFHQMATWEEALAAAKANAPCNMLLLKDYTIPAGYYTIPEGVTLIIPKDADQVSPKGNIIQRYKKIKSDGNWSECAISKTAYRKLTLQDGCHLDVFGTIEVGGMQDIVGQGIAGVGHPAGTYGQLIVKEGATITLENGSCLRAWGFVTGDIENKDANDVVPCGEIEARRGSKVYEQFQIMDWKGGTCSVVYMMGNQYKVFPVTQYFIQNIEIPTTYHPGAKLLCATGMVMSKNEFDCDALGIVGAEYNDGTKDDAMFLMKNADDSEDTWVRKYYDSKNDKQVYEINNSARLGNLRITMSGYTLESKEYILPITNNMHIHLLNGEMNITQSTEMLPGAEIEVDKQSEVTVNEGQTLYLYDSEEWGAYAYNGYYAHQVLYSPIFEGKPNKRAYTKKTVADAPNAKPSAAKLNIHGTLNVLGSLYTTETGANIYSTNEDAGTIVYSTSAPSENIDVYQVTSSSPDYDGKTCIPSLLRNTDPLYPTTTTAGTPAGQSYCYMNGRWTMMTVDPVNECFVKDNYNNYYAKPGAYVQLANGKTENADHTYSDAAGQGRLYILTDECQWWEVVLDNNLYKGITRDAEDVASPNGKYYAYNTTTHKWEEKRYTITWKDWDGTVITTYQLTYGVTPKYLSTNPTREANLDYTYDFTGWSPAIVPVAGDQIYTATYTQTPVRYTITFKNSDGTILEHQFLTRGTTPTPPEVTNEDKILQWTPSVGAVTGNQIYTATWLDNRPATWTITWKNYDGTLLDTTTPADGATAETVSAGAPDAPVKPATTEYTYSFTGWTPAVVAATSDATYTASYSEERKTYTVNFYKEGTTNETKSDPANLLVSRTGLYMGGAVTLPDPLPTKSEAGKTFTLQWKNMANDQIVGTGVPAVSDNADYVADFSLYTVSRYTVSVRIQDESGNAVSGCAATGSGTYDHGTEVTINVTPAARFKYWDDDHENTNPQRTFSLTAAQNLTAICVPNENVAIGETVEYGSDETYYDFVISADENHSSQVVGANHVKIATGGHAYFDLVLNTPRRHWKAFTVPFEVDLSKYPIIADGVSMPLGVQYDIVWYDGAERAANGKTPDCWKYVEDQTDWILTPGVAYMIVFGRDVNTVRFTKKDKASVAYSGTVSVAENNGASDDVNGGWNGIGNPATYHALLNAGVTECQVHNGEEIGSDGYITCDMGKFIVGKAVFVQVAASQPVVVNKATSGDSQIAAAPRRAKANTTGKNRFDVQIAPVDGQMADRMFLHADEYKEDKYVILQDLAKAGLSTKRAQMWVERYDTKLCKNTALLFNGVAEFPLGIFAPQAGEYEISVAESPDEESTLYLTLDGVPVWNLSYGPYTANLEKGTTARYGLKWVRNYIPAISTSVDNTQADKQPTAQKILLNGKVYILRGENVYSADGQLVK